MDEVQVLADCLNCCTELRELDISGNNLSHGETLATGLMACRTLERIRLCHNDISTDGMSAIFTSIKHCQLRVDIQELIKGNKLTRVDLLRNLQLCTNLHSLDITVYYSDEIKELSKCSKGWTSLKELEVYMWRTAEEEDLVTICDCLHNFRELQKLSLNEFCINGRGAECLAMGLSYCPHLQVLHLRKNTITATSTILRHCTNIKELNLGRCGIKCCGATELDLSSCPNLQSLELCDNDIKVQGAQKLATNLHHCTKLTKLNFNENSIGKDGAKAIIRNLNRCTQVKELDLCNNKIGRSVETLAASLCHYTQLKKLALSDNNIGEESANALAIHIHHCAELNDLDLSINEINENGANALANDNSLCRCIQLQKVKLNGNKISVKCAKELFARLELHCTELIMPDFKFWHSKLDF